MPIKNRESLQLLMATWLQDFDRYLGIILFKAWSVWNILYVIVNAGAMFPSIRRKKSDFHGETT